MKTIRALALPLVAVLATVLLVVVLAGLAGALTNRWAVVGLVSALGAAWLIFRLTRSWVPARTVLEIDFDRGVVEQTPSSPLAYVQAAKAYPLRDLLDALEQAASDRRVTGVLARLGGTGIGVARAQEIADAIRTFRASGKPAVAFAETFGELRSGSLTGIYLGANFDELYLQPGGEFGMTGIVRRKFYLRGLLDKLGVTPQFDHRHEYKAAKYIITEDHMVEPDREATSSYVGAQFEQLVVGIAEGRSLPAGTVRALVDRAPLLAEEATQAGLVDDLLYRDQLLERIKATWGKDARTLDLATYLKRVKRPHRRGPTIALIYGTGTVVQGASRFDPLTREPAMGSDDLARAFRLAIDDKKVKAIVFRIDSPGGSAVASYSIWRETQRAIAAGKPVIATMGDVAGSGGYYVAAGCTKILAQPGTLTGSIGVVGGKLVTKEAWARAGITFDDVIRGDNARFMTGDYPFTEAENERFQAILDSIYDDFVGKVASGRSRDLDAINAVARGRVWAGSDALAHGLIDELGGIRRAIGLALEAAGLAKEKPHKVGAYPPPRGPVASLLSRDSRDDAAIGELLAATAPLAELAGEIRGLTDPAVLSMPGVRARP
jgi:protease-4